MRRNSAAYRLTPIPMKLDRQEAIVRVRGISYRGLFRRGPIDETPNRKPLSVHASEVPSMDLLRRPGVSRYCVPCPSPSRAHFISARCVSGDVQCNEHCSR